MMLKDSAKKMFKAWEKKYLKGALGSIEESAMWKAVTIKEKSGKDISKELKTAETTRILLGFAAIVQLYLIRYTNHLADCENNRVRVRQFLDCQKVKMDSKTMPKFNFVFSKGHLDFPLMLGIDDLKYMDFYIIWTLTGFKEIMVFNPEWDKWTKDRIKIVSDNIINDMRYDEVKVKITPHVVETPEIHGSVLIMKLKFAPTALHDFTEAFGPAIPDSW
ncbi:MAG: hypothetical protein WC637_06985 [Victivallales bacterium]|jgi:hypothetical protein